MWIDGSLTFPKLSRTTSFTDIENQVVPGGSAAGIIVQSAVGMVNTGPAVVCVNAFATPYVHSQPTIVPGAVEVLPLKVQLIVLPPFVRTHVSVSDGPVTPKLAIACMGGGTGVTDSVARTETPL